MKDYPTPFQWIPEDDYHAASRRGEFVSSHLLADFAKSPALYRRTIDGLVPHAKSDAFAFGTAAHKLILEGREAFDREYLVAEGPVNPKTGEAFGPNTKAYREWASAQAPRTVISPRDAGRLNQMLRSVQEHKDAIRLLGGGFPEGSVRASWAGLPCQIRIDWFNPREGIVDLKSCEDLDRFEIDARRFGYGEQMAFYRAVLTAATGDNQEDVPVHMIAVEKSEPFRCGVWLVDGLWLDDRTRFNAIAMARMVECRRTETWPTGYEDLRVLSDLK